MRLQLWLAEARRRPHWHAPLSHLFNLFSMQAVGYTTAQTMQLVPSSTALMMLCVQSKAEMRLLRQQRKQHRAATAAPDAAPGPDTLAPAPVQPKREAEPDTGSDGAGLPINFFQSAKRAKLEPKAEPAPAAAPAAAPGPAPRSAAAPSAGQGNKKPDGAGVAPAAAQLPEGFFDDAAADARAHGQKPRTAEDEEAALAQLARDVDAMEKECAEADATDAAQAAARQLELDKHELRSGANLCTHSAALYHVRLNASCLANHCTKVLPS